MDISRASWSWLIVLAALVVVIAGLRAASSLLEPFLMAIFISIFCAPAVSWLRRLGLPEAMAVMLVVISLMIVMLVLAAGLGASVNSFVRSVPEYQQILTQRLQGLIDGLPFLDFNVAETPLLERIDPGFMMGLAGRLAAQFGAALGNFLLVVLAVAFILLEAARLPAKLHAALGDASSSVTAFDGFAEGVYKYLAIKSAISLTTGILVALMLWALDVDFPVLWGTVAFFFNYIPNIGSFIAAIPACLLAFVLHGTGTTLLAVGGYVVINTLMGSILEPRLLGRSLGLSTLVVFISLIFWGWVLGPVGMVLSVPLTMILRIALDANEDTRWIAILLGPEVESADAPAS